MYRSVYTRSSAGAFCIFSVKMTKRLYSKEKQLKNQLDMCKPLCEAVVLHRNSCRAVLLILTWKNLDVHC